VASLVWRRILPGGGAQSCCPRGPRLERWNLPRRSGGRVMGRGAETDRLIVRLAAANNRVVTRRVLDVAGGGTNAITTRVANGRLYRRHHGVYLLDPPERASRVTLLTAAVEACGPGAVLSHQSAAELWGLLPAHAGLIEVTMVIRCSGDRPEIRRHRVGELDPADIRTRHGIPVTSPARTILDNARHPLLEELIASAFDKGLVTERQIEASIDRTPTRRGVRRVRRVLSQRGGPRLTRCCGSPHASSKNSRCSC